MMAKTLTFWRFIKAQRLRTDPVGDFAREALADVRFPRRAWKRATLIRYLKCRQAGVEVFRAYDRAQAEWQSRVMP